MADKRSGRRRGPTSAKLIRTTVYLRTDESDALKIVAAKQGIAASEIVRQALRRFLELMD
jgi:hypothetical protein